MRSPVLHALDVPKDAVERYHILLGRVVNVPKKNSDGICSIRPGGGHRVHTASDHQLVCGRITGLFIGFPLVTLHCYWRAHWPGLMHSELRHIRPKIPVQMDINCEMRQISFDVHVEIAGGTPEIIHLEPIHHRVFDLCNQAIDTNDQEIIQVQNECGNDYAMVLIMQHG
jgi:hypothetical protein